jgi:4-hydroxy-tetrahydrodipicolinate synthase
VAGGSLNAENIRSTPDSFAVLMGRNTLVLAGLLVGCVPRLVADICDRFQAGDLRGAQQAREKLAPLRRAFAWGTVFLWWSKRLSISWAWTRVRRVSR